MNNLNKILESIGLKDSTKSVVLPVSENKLGTRKPYPLSTANIEVKNEEKKILEEEANTNEIKDRVKRAIAKLEES